MTFVDRRLGNAGGAWFGPHGVLGPWKKRGDFLSSTTPLHLQIGLTCGANYSGFGLDLHSDALIIISALPTCLEQRQLEETKIMLQHGCSAVVHG